jgi:integrase
MEGIMLSDVECRNAKPREKAYKLYDRDGLHLEITPTSKKYWRYKYYFQGKEKRLYIGAYPQVSLLEARDKLIAGRKALNSGQDPAELKREQKQLAKFAAAQTFKLVADEWYEQNKSRWSDSHAKNISYRLTKDVFPEIGDYPIANLKVPHVFSCLQKIELRGHEMARRALQMTSQVFKHAARTGRVERDITFELKGCLKRPEKGHYAAIEVEELPTFVKKLYFNKARLYRQTELALQLMLLTFVRTRELIEAPWTEFDLEKAEWNIPPERMKMKKAHLVPLSKQAIAILLELKQLNGKHALVFPSIINKKKPMSNNTLLKALDILGYKHKMTGHGFRALAMSAIKEKLGFQHEVVDRQLAHQPKNKVDQAYDRAKFTKQRTEMMQAWADYIESLK